MRRQYYNYSSSELFLFFHLPFIFPPGGGHMVHCLCVCACFDVLVCMYAWEGASIARKIPLRGICIGLLCYSKLSGTLVPTYLSMSVQTAENKLICFPFPPTFSLFLFESLLSSLCVALHPFLASFFNFFFPSSLCCCKVLHFLSNSLLSVLLIPRKLVLISYQCTGVFFSLLELNLVYNSIFSTSVHAKSKKTPTQNIKKNMVLQHCIVKSYPWFLFILCPRSQIFF